MRLSMQFKFNFEAALLWFAPSGRLVLITQHSIGLNSVCRPWKITTMMDAGLGREDYLHSTLDVTRSPFPEYSSDLSRHLLLDW